MADILSNYYSVPSACRVYLNGTQSIPHNTLTKVHLNTEVFDLQGEFDNATNYRFTATQSGYYLCVANVHYSLVVDQVQYWIQIFVNGSSNSQFVGTTSSGNDNIFNGSTLLSLSASDYVELYVIQTSGVSRNINGGSSSTWMSIIKVA